jgi:hypothetical protein
LGRPKSTRPAQEKTAAAWLQPYHFKPGQSGNPAGKPKRKPITDRYREQLEVLAPRDVAEEIGLPPTATMADVIARRMAIRAINSRQAVEATREMREAIEGKAPSTLVDFSHKEIVVNVNYGSRRNNSSTLRD